MFRSRGEKCSPMSVSGRGPFSGLRGWGGGRWLPSGVYPLPTPGLWSHSTPSPHRQPALTMFHPRPQSRVHIGPEWAPGQGKQPCIQEGPFPNWPGRGGREQRNRSLGCPWSGGIILTPPPLFLLRFELPWSPWSRQALSRAP